MAFYALLGGTVVGLFFYAFFMLAPLVMVLIVYLILRNNEAKKLKKYFQESVVSKIVQSMGPDFEYQADGKINESILTECRLFMSYDRYQCEDLVTGTIEGNRIMHAEIDLKKHSKSSKSKSKSSTTQVFKGVFFMLYLKLKIPAPFFILSYAEMRFIDKPALPAGRLSRFFPGVNQNRGDRIDTGHEPFEKSLTYTPIHLRPL